MQSERATGYREPSPPLLRTYRLRLRGWHLLALLVTAAGLAISLVALRYGVVVLPCIVVWIPGLFYALTSALRRIRVYADRVEIERAFRPRLELPMRELELRQWPYGIELAGGGRHIKLVPESFASPAAFDDLVGLVSQQIEQLR